MNKSRKILYLITKSNFGGAQKYVFELAIKAAQDGNEVAVACGGAGKEGAQLGLLAEKLTEAGIRVIPVPHFMRDMSLKNDFLAFFDVLKILRKVRPDVFHVTSSKAGGIGALAGRLTQLPRIVFTSHGLTMDETWRPKWQQLLITIGTWCTLRLAHHSIMISTETYERASTLPQIKDRVSLVKNGIAPIAFISKDEARHRLLPDASMSTFWLGGIGELHPNKNWSAAIFALVNLPQHIHLIIIGEGEERAQLELLTRKLGLENRVHLLGFIDNASQYLKAFDVFILPSKKEGLPYVLMEAGLAGIPVIASDIPGNHDIIDTGETGFLIEPTAKMITTSLSMLIRDEGMYRRLGIALQESVTREFSIEKMYNATFAVYDSSNSLAS